MRRRRRILAGLLTAALACALAAAQPAAAHPAIVRPAAAHPAAAPPGVPALIAPETGQTVAGNPALQWSAVPSAVKYRVQVSASASFASLLYSADTPGLRATPPSDLPLGAIFWRVAATDGGTGIGQYAQSQFVKEAATQPLLTAPADASALAYPATTPVLRWTALAGVKQYRVELDDAEDFIGASVFTTAGPALAITAPLILDKDYYWHVQGVSATAGVTTNYSPAWRFRMTWPAPAGQPVLSSPVGGPSVDVTDVVFQWAAVAGAKDYQIQVSPNEDFANNMTDDEVVTGTQYSPATTYNNATYFWRVRAQDTGSPQHQGPWSATGVFKRSWLPQPFPLAPRDGGTSTGERFSWTPVARASHYELQFSTDPNFSTFAAKCTTSGTTLTATIEVLPGGHPVTMPPEPLPTTPNLRCSFGLNPGGHYYWRVRGLDLPAGVNGVFSEATDFYYRPGDSPVLISPRDGGVTPVPVLTWEPVAGFSKYRVTVVRGDTGATTTADTYGLTYTPTADLVNGKNYTWYVTGLTLGGRAGVAPTAAGYGHFTYTDPGGAGDIDPVAASNTGHPSAAPSMSWQPVAGASYYRVYSGAPGQSVFTSLSGVTKLYQAAYTATTALAPGEYSWFAEAYDSANALLATSGTATFTVGDLEFAEYVGPPNCVLPGCVAEQPSTPELTWKAVPGAGMYRVWTALDSGFTNVVRGYTTEHTSLTPRESYLDNAAGQSYFWFVQPCKSLSICGPFENAGLAGRAQAFRKKSAPVALAAPADGATVTDVVSLSWDDYRSTAPTGTGAKQYRVQVATDSAFANLSDEAVVDQTSYQAWGESYPDNVYYWRVQAIDGGGAPMTFSAPRQFRKTAAVPVPVTLPGASTALPTLTWGALPYLAGYAVEVYRGEDPAFPSGSKVLSATTALPALTPTAALPAGVYSWRVRKLDPGGHPGPWSPPGPSFTVAQPAPALNAPADGAQLASSDLMFTWDAVPGAAAYRLETSTSAAFTPTAEKVTTVMTAWAATAVYADGAPYLWRVSVLDGAGNVLGTSLPRTFVKDAAGPRVSSVSPVTGLAVDGTLTVTFSEPVHAAGLLLTPAGSAVAVPGVTAVVSPSTATFRPSVPLVPGQSYDLSPAGTVTDLFGNPVVVTATRVRAATAIEDSSPALTQAWDSDLAAAASGGAYVCSRRAGAAAEFTFTGTTVSVLGFASAAGGAANVYLDGVQQPAITFASPKAVYRKTVFSRTGLANTRHALVVRVAGTKAAAQVSLDAFVAGGVTYQENAPSVRTSFGRVTAAAASGSGYATTPQEKDAAGAEYRFSFAGTGFTWLATRGPSGGSASVYVDGTYRGTISEYARVISYRTPVYNSPLLPAGVHSVRLVATGVQPSGSTGTDVSLDAVTTR